MHRKPSKALCLQLLTTPFTPKPFKWESNPAVIYRGEEAMWGKASFPISGSPSVKTEGSSPMFPKAVSSRMPTGDAKGKLPLPSPVGFGVLLDTVYALCTAAE